MSERSDLIGTTGSALPEAAEADVHLSEADDFVWDANRPLHCPNCGLPTDQSGAFCARCPWDLVDGGTPAERKFSQIDCRWCDFQRKRSWEDIFPSWLMKEFPNRPEVSVNQLRKAIRIAPPENCVLHVARPRHPTRPAYRLLTHDVCEICNNGWMSRLQTKMKPIIQRLNRGIDRSMIQEERDTISRWILMTAVNLHRADKVTARLPSGFSDMAQGSRPMDGSLICGIGLLSDHRSAGNYERYSPVVPIIVAPGQFAGVSLGWLIIERLAFGFAMATGPRMMSFLDMTYELQPADRLRTAGFTLISASDSPTSISHEPLTIDGLKAIRPYDL